MNHHTRLSSLGLEQNQNLSSRLLKCVEILDQKKKRDIIFPKEGAMGVYYSPSNILFKEKTNKTRQIWKAITVLEGKKRIFV